MLLYKEQYDQIVQMVGEGYPLTDRLLESLYRLGRKDIIAEILKVSLSVDSSADDFLHAVAGVEPAVLRMDALSRRKALEDSARETEEQELEAKKRGLEQDFKEKLKSGISADLFDLAHMMCRWKEVIEKFGAEVVYEAAKNDNRYLWEVQRELPPEFLYERGDFKALWLDCRYYAHGNPDEVYEWVKKISTYRGGVAALYALDYIEIDRILVHLGYIKLFFKDSDRGYRRLAKVKRLTLDDLRNLYHRNPQEVARFIRHHGTIKQRAALFLGMLRK